MKARIAEPEGRQLYLKTTDGELRITIPHDAKLTFGPAIPYTARGRFELGAGSSGYALRVYKGNSKENLVACFNGVIEFRDVGLPVEKLVIREAGKAVWKSNEKGFKVEQAVERDSAFVDELKLLASGKDAEEQPF